MWDRPRIKENGRLNFQKNYWSCVAVSILLILAYAGLSTSGFKINLNGDFDPFHHGYNGGAFNDYARSFYYGFSGIGALLTGIAAAVASMVGLFVLAVRLLVANPYQVGACRFYMDNRTKEKATFSAVKAGFTGNFGNVVLTQFLKNLYTALWSLLFVIPGIVRAYAYFAVPYILAEKPNMDHKQVLDLSRKMTYGYKWHIFVTHLSFILWGFLSAITAGIVGVFYLNPRVDATNAEMYAFIRYKAFESGVLHAPDAPTMDSDIPEGE